eukprot:Lankesteria_metandrocarpae@DN3805_c0_g1_i1.p1
MQKETYGTELFDETGFDILTAQHLPQGDRDMMEDLIAPSIRAVSPSPLMQKETYGTELFDETGFDILTAQHLPQGDRDMMEDLIAPSQFCKPGGSVPSEPSALYAQGYTCGNRQFSGDAIDFLKTACDEYDITGAEGILQEMAHLRPDLSATCRKISDGRIQYGCKSKGVSCEVTRYFDT